ncbi:MAG: hypothetical protein Q4G36_05680 [Paracoccus sp. (in: a-proteobacteria)]|nr:hypothetical protein [Paracoccus sp. (in: a-proteobacteria)]
MRQAIAAFLGRAGADRGGRALLIGAGLTGLWLLMLLAFWLASDGGSGGAARWVSVIAALMPLALIWLAVGLARAVDALQAEADLLRAMLEQIHRETGPRPLPGGEAVGRATPAAETRPDAPTARPAPPRPAAQPARPAPPAPEARQQSLSFDDPKPADLAPMTLILALNFPDGPDDDQGIAALREALRHPDHARLLRSAQDVVSLLAARDLYMDELRPAPADPAAWLRFAEGQRGQAVAAVGAIRDADAVERAVEVMRGDEIFRDAVHHFLRLFDRSMTRLLPQLSDEAIGWLAETRSARAFMLMGRAAGLFGQDG